MAIRYQWTDETETTIKVTLEDGTEAFVPTDPANRHYAEILEQEIEPEPFPTGVAYHVDPGERQAGA